MSDKLKALLGQYDEQLKQSKDKQDQKQSEEQAFIAKAEACFREVVKPALRKIEEQLKAAGHSSFLHQDFWRHDQKDSRPQIELKVRLTPPAGRESSRGSSEPTFSFHATIHSKKIECFTSTAGSWHGGSGGMNGSFTLEQITPDLVETKFVEYFEKLLKDASPKAWH